MRHADLRYRWQPVATADAGGRGRDMLDDYRGSVADPTIHESAEVSDAAMVGDGSSIWQLVHVRENAVIGQECVIGRGAYIGPGVLVGDRTKIQNAAMVYDPAEIGCGVFIGPGVILTNDRYPRAVAADGSLKRADGWTADGVRVGDGASIGAGSVVLAGVTVGEWALVGAGSVVIRDVPAHSLVVGNPARHVAWVGRDGQRLQTADDGSLFCPDSGERYLQFADHIAVVDQ